MRIINIILDIEENMTFYLYNNGEHELNFGIIGTGNMGMGLATQLGKAGYEVTLGSRDPIKAKSNAKSIPGEV
ncbi:MAG: NAD(P)-binding domain-containing protein, partial [Candidatus Hodarchaeales archaeon]